MANYEVTQISDGTLLNDICFPYCRCPRISDDGSRIVYSRQIEPDAPLYVIWLYDRNASDQPVQLTVRSRGEDKVLVDAWPHISGDGKKIIFSAEAYYTSDDKTGVYVYDIDTQTIRLVAEDRIPRYDTGAARQPETGLSRQVTSSPRISRDGQWITYLLDDFIGHGFPPTGHWQAIRRRLMCANITESRIRGDDILEIVPNGAFGHGIHGLSISGNGRVIAFYAGGVISNLEVENLQLPPYETIRHSDTASPTCDVYCYAVQIRGGGEYALRCIPEPQDSHRPLVVAHPFTSSINGFNVGNILANGPSISSNGRRIALNAGVIMGSRDMGVYVSEPFGGETHKVISFDGSPGEGPDDTVLTTGIVPTISPDGRWVAYQRSSLAFRHNYADREEYVEGETYCPKVVHETVVVQQLPRGETSIVMDSGSDEDCVPYTSRTSLSIANEAASVAINSRLDQTGSNPDNSHEIFLATLVPE